MAKDSARQGNGEQDAIYGRERLGMRYVRARCGAAQWCDAAWIFARRCAGAGGDFGGAGVSDACGVCGGGSRGGAEEEAGRDLSAWGVRWIECRRAVCGEELLQDAADDRDSEE